MTLKTIYDNRDYQIDPSSERFKHLESLGYNPYEVISNNISINPEQDFGEDGKPSVMSNGAEILFNYKLEDGSYPVRDLVNRFYDKVKPGGIYNVYNPPGSDQSRPPEAMFKDLQTDEEKMEYMINWISMWDMNLTNGIIQTANMRNMDDQSQLDFYNLYDYFNEKAGLPNFSKDGVWRVFKGLFTDPLNLVGLGVYKQGVPLIDDLIKNYAGKDLAKTLLKHNMSKRTLAFVEGGLWMAVDDANRQAMQIQSNNDAYAIDQSIAGLPNEKPTSYDPVQGATSFVIGGIFGLSLGELAETGIPFAYNKGKELFQRGPTFDKPKSNILGSGPVVPISFKLTKNEIGVINKLDLSKKEKKDLTDRVKKIKSKFADNDDFINPDLGGVIIKRNKKGEPKYTFKWVDPETGELPKYKYHITPEGMDDETYKSQITENVVNDIKEVFQRASEGDAQAQQIISNGNWYRAIQNRLRTEYGGLGDVFADLLASTSAGVDVAQNFKNSKIILEKFTKGEYDLEIEAFMQRMEEGGDLSKFEKDFPLISNDAGKLFNTNSPKATISLLGLFRDIQSGKKPKTINFLGNIMGINPEATIDVWANRFIGKHAGGKWYPAHADVVISGGYRGDLSTAFENPDIGSEFGFAQEIFRRTTDSLQGSELNEFLDLEKLEPRDIQAIAWFIEKDRWDKGGWTNEAGGSYDTELNFAGQVDQEKVRTLRSKIRSKNTLPEDKIKFQEELDQLIAPQERSVVGVSRQQGDVTPTNVEQAQLSENLSAPLKVDDNVNAFQSNNNLGVWKEGETVGMERSLNMEIVTNQDWDNTEFKKTFINELKENNQWSGFIAKTNNKPLSEPNNTPGFEIFFDRQETADTKNIEKLKELLLENDVPFAYITDSRYKDLPRVQAGSNVDTEAGITGIRVIYVPDYDDAFDPARAEDIKNEIMFKYLDLLEKIEKEDYIRTSQLLHFNLEVFNKGKDY